MTPVPVSTRRCLASLPKTGPKRAPLRSHTFDQLAPLSVDLISAPSTSQYRAPSCQRGRATADPSPAGPNDLPPSVVRTMPPRGRSFPAARATTAVSASKTQAGPYPLPTSANDLPPSRDSRSSPPDSCFRATTNFSSASVQSTAHQSTWLDFGCISRSFPASVEPTAIGPP